MSKNFLDNVNLITGKEQIIFQFKIEKSKEGIEKIYIQNNPIANDLILSGLDEKEKKEIETIKREFKIKDDYGDEGGNNRIGTTLTNLLNKSDDILIILEKYRKIVKEENIERIEEVYAKILTLIDKFKLKQLNIEKVLNLMYKIYYVFNDIELSKKIKDKKIIYREIISQYEEIQKNKYYEVVNNFLEELYLLKAEYLEEIELIILTENILDKNDEAIENCYKNLLLKIMKELENKLKSKINLPLKFLLYQMFSIFYKDYEVIKEEKALNKFWLNTYERYKQRIYNTYYEKTSIYMNSLYDKSINRIKEIKRMPKGDIELPKKFENFSYQDMAIIFVQSLIDDIEFMINNYENRDLNFTNISLLKAPNSDNKYEILFWNELFYVSMYYIFKNKTTLKKCKTCNKIFIAQKPNRDKNCQRKCPKNNKLTCREYADKSYRKGNGTKNEVSKIVNKIYAMLNKRLENDKIDTNKFSGITKELESLKNKYEDNEEVLLKKLEEFHFKLKNNIDL